ncbi:MAG TPA: hypothetical protein VII09_00855 [Opitutaceae bacterium]
MKPEPLAWKRLQDHAAAQLSPGFPDRVLRAAREHASPLFVAQFAMCAATAALCLGAVILFNARSTAADDANSLAGWSEIASQANELEQGL